jgi:Fic family protein
LHPVVLAAEMSQRFANIHPFVDGNGRTSRLIMNLILLRHGFVLANIKGDNKNRVAYYNALETAHTQNNTSVYQEYVAKVALACLQRYVKII